MTTTLTSGRTLRLTDAMPVARLLVRSGTVWLTTTPADADVILRAGDVYRVDGRRPIVVQAMTRVDMELVPAEARPWSSVLVRLWDHVRAGRRDPRRPAALPAINAERR